MKVKQFSRAYLSRRYTERKHWLASIKVASGCLDCKLSGPAEALTFDHVQGEKKFDVGPSWNQSRAALEAEVAKCEVVCANCHAIRTAKRLGNDPAFIPFPKIPRLFRPISITEKIDGTHGIVWVDGELDVWAGSKNRWLCVEDDNHGFAVWVKENAEAFAELGPMVYHGEWWGQGINRGYGLKEKRFSLFNVAKWSDPAVRPACCHVVPVVFEAQVFNETAVRVALAKLRFDGSLAAPGYMKPEGVVVYHKAGNFCFKVTLEGDDKPKSE